MMNRITRLLSLLRPKRIIEAVRDESGQNAVEYTMIVWFTAAAVFIGRPMWMILVDSLQMYFDSFYLVLSLPFP